MNAYYENVNVRYNDNVRSREIPSRRFGDGLISFICALIGMVTCPAAIALEKAAVIFALFISFGSVVGAIEAELISMLFGIIICAGISFVQFLMLKSLIRSSKKTDKGDRA